MPKYQLSVTFFELTRAHGTDRQTDKVQCMMWPVEGLLNNIRTGWLIALCVFLLCVYTDMLPFTKN